MPIGGFVITVDPERKKEALETLAKYPQAEVHGADEKGNVVVVLETETSDEMEHLTKQLEKEESLLSVGITYFDAEDEVEKIEQGLIKPTFSFGRKGEKP